MRISELAGLRWSGVDRAENVIRVNDESAHRRTMGRKIGQTKSRGGRTNLIHNDLKPVLDGIARAKVGVIFHGTLGGALKADTVRNILVREVLTPLAERFPTEDGGGSPRSSQPCLISSTTVGASKSGRAEKTNAASAETIGAALDVAPILRTSWGPLKTSFIDPYGPSSASYTRFS